MGDYELISTVGRISYSIYLLHSLLFEYFFPHAFPAVLTKFFVRIAALIGFSLLPLIATSSSHCTEGHKSLVSGAGVRRCSFPTLPSKSLECS